MKKIDKIIKILKEYEAETLMGNTAVFEKEYLNVAKEIVKKLEKKPLRADVKAREAMMNEIRGCTWPVYNLATDYDVVLRRGGKEYKTLKSTVLCYGEECVRLSGNSPGPLRHKYFDFSGRLRMKYWNLKTIA